MDRWTKKGRVLMNHTTEQGVAAYNSSLVYYDEEGFSEGSTQFVRYPETPRCREVVVAFSGAVVLLECRSDTALFRSATDASCKLALDVGLGFGQSHDGTESLLRWSE